MIDVSCKVKLIGRDDREYGLAETPPHLIVRSTRFIYDRSVTLDMTLVDGFTRSITVDGDALKRAIDNAMNKGTP